MIKTLTLCVAQARVPPVLLGHGPSDVGLSIHGLHLPDAFGMKISEPA